jgi:hypothetical protein
MTFQYITDHLTNMNRLASTVTSVFNWSDHERPLYCDKVKFYDSILLKKGIIFLENTTKNQKKNSYKYPKMLPRAIFQVVSYVQLRLQVDIQYYIF